MYWWKFIRPFKSYLSEDVVYSFIRSMIDECKYCSAAKNEKILTKKLVITKKDNEDFENSTKCWFCDNDNINNNVKVRSHYHIKLKYSGS